MNHHATALERVEDATEVLNHGNLVEASVRISLAQVHATLAVADAIRLARLQDERYTRPYPDGRATR